MSYDLSPAAAPGWRRPLWLALLVAASLAFSLGFACVTPFAGLAAGAALTLPRRDALGLATAAWLGNQLVGFGFLGYPYSADTLAWGLAIGVAALAAVPAARAAAARSPGILRPAAALVAGFAAYEAVLFLVALTALGGTETFSPDIVSRLFLVDAAALAGLLLLHRLGQALGLAALRPLGGALRPI